MNMGKITQVLGAVIDVEFSDGSCRRSTTHLRSAIRRSAMQEGNLVIEVAQHLGENTVRCVAMDTTEGLVRGMNVMDTGAGITVPVGAETLGRMLNVIGQPVDEAGANQRQKILSDSPPHSGIRRSGNQSPGL